MQLRKKYVQRKIINNAEATPDMPNSRNVRKDYLSKLEQNNNQSLYLNKVLQKNLGPKKADSNYPYFKENISNFHSNIQNILSNEERRQKAMKYVIDMRNRKLQISPANDRNNPSRNNDEFNYSTNNGHYKTLGDDFYYSKQRKRHRTDALRPEYNNISN
jgi:hypothetical protein